MSKNLTIRKCYEHCGEWMVQEFEFYGCDEDEGTASALKVTNFPLKRMLNGLNERNSSNIRIDEIEASYFVNNFGLPIYGGKKDATVRCYSFLVQDVIEFISIEEATQYGVNCIINVDDTFYGVMNPRRVLAVRVFRVHHYNRDGQEQWYYDYRGNMVTNMNEAMFSTKSLATNAKRYKATYDGCAQVEMGYLLK